MRTLAARPNGDRVRWQRPENLHVTLRFLGEVSSSVLPDVVAAVGGELEGIQGFDCHLKDVRLFPDSKHPKVIAVGLDAEGHLTELAAAVERGACRAGLPPESRALRAHLTIGRLRGHGFPSVHGGSELGSSVVPVDRVVLFSSDLQPGGPVYTPIEAIPLRPSQQLGQLEQPG